MRKYKQPREAKKILKLITMKLDDRQNKEDKPTKLDDATERKLKNNYRNEKQTCLQVLEENSEMLIKNIIFGKKPERMKNGEILIVRRS